MTYDGLYGVHELYSQHCLDDDDSDDNDDSEDSCGSDVGVSSIGGDAQEVERTKLN